MGFIERVVIRVDASVEMGMGHLTRCISLGNALAAEGAEVFFLLRSHAKPLTRLIEANGHHVRLLPDPPPGRAGVEKYSRWLSVSWHQDAEQTLEVIGRIGPIDWLIVDHYALDARWERLQRQRSPRILAIDDLADRPHDCEILLDQNLVENWDVRYSGWLPGTCKQLLGPRYALLRPEFARQRRFRDGRSGSVDRILICYGGSDPSNETVKALEAINSLSCSLTVDVVVGLSNPHADQLSKACLDLRRTKFLRGAENMAELMSRADLAIGAGGVMSWERCCVGLPTVAVDIAANQVGALTKLAEIGAVVYLGSARAVTTEHMASAIQRLLDDPIRTRSMGLAASGLVDGQGSRRVRDEMKRLTVL